MTVDEVVVDVTPCFGKNTVVKSPDYIKLPTNWSPMGSTEFSKTEELRPDSQEYKKVEKMFNCTAGGTVKEIKKIERVQTPSLYRRYAVHRKEMKRHSEHAVSTERRLWHGTTEQAVVSINVRGFNRSYCGKNDASGVKRIYLALVLTGEYTTGNQSLIVPPDNPAKPGLPFDSVVDSVSKPDLFVIFSDTQAYPQYLITFK
ncbi:Protein mono-ADP-ribosyltransferase PARP14 [Lamellibrachia satsuma]|nr:Protein mono-ADP-ribosyltransferase PARP14 [Lamellibrachia satsuma]